MGIRDEIAFLMCTSKSLGEYSDAIDDVLSILDKWECVLEDTVCSHNYLNDAVRDLMKTEGNDWFAQVSEGDHIIVLRRRNESNS